MFLEVIENGHQSFRKISCLKIIYFLNLKLRSSQQRCSANYLYCRCQEAQIRHDTRKLNYFADQINFYQEAWKRGKKSKKKFSCRTHPSFARNPKKRGKGSKFANIFLERRKTGQNFRILLAEHIFNLPGKITRLFFCAELIRFCQ